MARTVLISEDSIIAMLKGLPEDTLMDVFSKMLVQGDNSPLTDDENVCYKRALKKYEKGEVISWEDLK